MMINKDLRLGSNFSSSNSESKVVKPENPLNRRIRRMAQILVSKETQNLQRPAIFRIRQASWQEWFKLTISLFCTVIFLYQDYDRVMYYLSVPVTVDVSILQQEDFVFPAVTICITDIGQLTNLLLTSEQKAKITSCEQETEETGEQVNNKSNIQFWKGRNDINATWIIAQLEPYLPVKQQNLIILPQGVCATFHTDAQVKFRRDEQKLNFDLFPINVTCGPFFPRLFCAHLKEEKPHYKDFLGILGFRGADYGIGIQKYKFINRRRRRCSSPSEYWKCIDKCQGELWPTLVPCRYHYLNPEMTHFQFCKRKWGFRGALARAIGKMAEIDPIKHCKCIQPCDRTIFKLNYRPRPTSEKIQRLALFFEDDFITNFEERYTYGFITLVCDVGGIMGLYLGLSLLSVCSLIQIMLPTINDPVLKQHTVWASDPIYSKVGKHYESLKARYAKNFENLLQGNILSAASSGLTPFRYIKKVLLVLCMISCLYVCYDRVMVYLSKPVMTTVEVQSQTVVEFPTLTWCQDIKDTIDLKKQLAEIRNLSSYCEVDFLDLLDIPGMTISNLWKIASINVSDPVKVKNKDYPSRKIQVLGESCLEFHLGKRVHKGRTMFEEIKILPQCDFMQKVYITPTGSEFDFSHYYIVSNDTFYPRLEFEIQERRVSPLLTNCFSAEETRKCKETCINKKMMDRLKCRFPMMPAAYNALPLCTSSKAAKDARATYIDVMVDTDSINDCKCLRECHKIIFESDIFVIPGTPFFDANLISMRAGFRDPDRQIYTELPFYTTIKLFCDIGGILGLFLGFSFLEFTDIVIIVTSRRCEKIFGYS